MADTSGLGRLAKFERLLFCALLLAHLAVVWALPTFLTQDGPSHLYNARIVLELWNADPTGLYRGFFTLNTALSPNWTCNILLVGLLHFFSPVVAEKVLVSLYMVALPLCFRHAVRTLSDTAPYLSSLVFLLVYNYHLVLGFFNFCMSLPVMFWFIATFHRFRVKPTWKLGIGSAILLLLLFATHPVALLVGFAAIGSDGLLNGIEAIRTRVLRAFTRRVARSIGIALPALALTVASGATNFGVNATLFDNKWSLDNWHTLLRFHHAVIFGGAEVPLYRTIGGLIGVFFVLAAVSAWRRLENKTLALAHLATGRLPFIPVIIAFCLSVHFFIADDLAGGAYLSSRIALIAYLLFFAWLAILPMTFVGRCSCMIISTVLCGLSLGVRYPRHAQCAELVDRYRSACAIIPKGSTVLPLCFSANGELGADTLSPLIRIFMHMSGYVAAEEGIISLDNY